MTKCAVNVGQKFEWNTNGSSSGILEGKPCLDVPYLIQIISNMALHTTTGTQGNYFSSQTSLAFWNGKEERISLRYLSPIIINGRHCIIHPYPPEPFGSCSLERGGRQKKSDYIQRLPSRCCLQLFGNALFSLSKDLQPVAGEQAGEGCI